MEKQMVVRQARATEQQSPVECRVSLVAAAMVELQALGLGAAELVAVVSAIHAQVMEAEGTTVMITATCAELAPDLISAQVTGRSVAVNSPAPYLVARTVEELVKVATPALWSEIQRVLEAEHG